MLDGMGYEWLIARRYIWSKRRHPFVGVISTISILGVLVGVAALIVVLAVMNGFDDYLRERVIGTRSHLVVEKEGAFDAPEAVIAKIQAEPRVRGVSPFIEGQALLETKFWRMGVLVRGIDPAREGTVSRFEEYLQEGRLAPSGAFMVVGSELAKRYRLTVGSEVALLTPSRRKTAPYTVSGIFSSGMYEYDANIIFLNLEAAQAQFGLGEAVSGLSVALNEERLAESWKRELQERLGFPFYVRSWMDMNKSLFGALKLEKIVMFLILALIICVACLNIAGSLTILVMDKTKDIGVLKALGATPASLVRIFSLDGLIVGFLGVGLGCLAGTAICFFLKHFSFVELPKEIYYVDRLPVQMHGEDLLWIVGIALLLCFFSALYPAFMAGKMDPVKALRYE